jgi:hypothetical protein
MLNFLNKRKREIERLNSIINGLIEKNEQLERVIRITKSEKDLSERALTIANKSVLDLTHEIKYLKMRIENSKGEVNTRYY